ncbi:hypothetical protein ACH35V_19835 [Actinomadura sp. 1N219]|uniref:hypothetical protein n=1 Tax=Actinomadura sp. 1N219 TaxID=3375152 RepID=UPI0037A76DDC
MDVTVVDAIERIPADEFDALDDAAGVAGCHARLRQLEQDGRWHVEYHCVRDGGRLLAAVPAYLGTSDAWPDDDYAPSAWGHPKNLTPATSVLVGGRADLYSTLHRDTTARNSDLTRRLIAHLHDTYGGDHRSLVFAYFTDAEIKGIQAAAPADIDVRDVGRDARFDRHLVPEPDLGYKVRSTLRRDLSAAERAGLRARTVEWDEVAADASRLVADHNLRKGRLDHPDLVAYRMDQWRACPGAQVLVVEAAAGDVRGYQVCVSWRDWLHVHEIGLTPGHGATRHAVYAHLILHGPLRLARRLGARRVRAGLASEEPKASRGATFTPITGGVLS